MHSQERWPIRISTKNKKYNAATRWYERSGTDRRAALVFQGVYFLIVLLLALVTLPRAGATPPPDAAPSLVAIGDVHGDFNDFVAILQRTGLIDEQRHWTGGKATFVQVGDLIDRGPKPREVQDLMMSLEEAAAKAGGRVVALLGNHEVMNLMGDLRYVTPENYASFADSESEKRRTAAYQKYAAWRKDHPQLLAELEQPVLAVTEEEWMTRHPLGFIEQRDAFSPNGVYGKWVRQRFAIAKIGGVLFLHGGISPKLVSMKLDAINAHIHSEIKDFDETRQYFIAEKLILPFFTLQEMVAVVRAELIAERKSHLPANELRQAKIEGFLTLGTWVSVREDGPLWFRGYDQWNEGDGAAQVDKVLAAYKATHIVVGHTVQKTAHIRSRFGGKVILIDTGMLASYYPGGRASALEIHDDDRVTATYLDQQEVLLEGKSAQSGQKDNK
jgi:calcineurin-like phosphoesterase family protein